MRLGHDVNTLSWLKLPSPSLSSTLHETSRPKFSQASQLTQEGGGAPCGTLSAEGSSGRRILGAGFTLQSKTHTQGKRLAKRVEEM
ncbi:hypothetical protein NQZ68_002930 [Dissostichus eleginoides]|nr:hypothetical protein NQZ68_002930 [Dissostichus eleginoides]